MTSEENNSNEDSGNDGGGRERKSSSGSKKPHRILLVPYPKFVFMYPTLIVSCVCWLVLWVGGFKTANPEEDILPVVMTQIFLAVSMANLFVLVFDFPRATSLTLIFLVTTAALGIWLTVTFQPDLIPAFVGFITSLRPVANANFFMCTFLGMLVMYIAIFISTKFNYWELSNNELLHHHGMLSDLKRYPAPNLRVDKEINDVFEYILLGSGRLILHPTTEKRAIVLDNILWVSKREQEMTKMLGSIKVKIGDDSGS
ncbi:hypothetical protein SV7mr_35920 [Stieleria bergensis]|uniref:Uncharacterized protein n=1 Tax=Stieleria bergensis TaxID=2528025 RepID=A0A517SYF5_9BACT|nr:hypothetical protein SV7mr_35920 [Planctomycetes bacterium SV_7m_r]